MKLEKHTRAQGFTLVELIVVIVILAILATIAFLSFSSQSASARDSKRKTDLSNIASKMNIAMANGSKVLDFVDTTNPKAATFGSLAGTGVTGASSTYKAGDINFNQLGVNPSDFKDPLSGTYKLGATSNMGGVFQLASKLENDEVGNIVSSGAFLVGNYSARTANTGSGNATASTGSSSTGGTLTLASNAVGFYRTNDTVYFGSAGICTVTSVSSDQAKINVSCANPLPVAATNLILGTGSTGANENAALMVGVDATKVVENGKNPPYN